MDTKKKVTISWSGGKDSVFALYKIFHSGQYEIVHLHTVLSDENRRVGLHGVPEELIQQQAQALGFPLKKLLLKVSDDHDAYTDLMQSFYHQCAEEGIAAVVFGDIFLEDLKAFREGLLHTAGITGVFPLWKTDTHILVENFLHAGFKTIICSANKKYFSADDLGLTLNLEWISQMPLEVDVCGENGEFHTFVYDGPIFKNPVRFNLGKVIEKTYSWKMNSKAGVITQLETFLFKEILDY